MFQPYSFYPKLIVRTPSLPFNESLSEELIQQKIYDPKFLEAIYLASPSLYEECLNWRDGKLSDPKKKTKIIYSLSKYLNRMSSRCTPFGLFAGCSVAEWAETTSLVLNPAQNHRNTRLDMHYACALAQRLAEIPEIQQGLHYYPNSSIYTVGEEIRYIEYKYINGRRSHQISAVTWSEYIQKVLDLCQLGALPTTIVEAITDEEITGEEAQEFLAQLIDSQLLVNELEPAITGVEFTQQILNVVEKINTKGKLDYMIEIIREVEKRLEHIDNQSVNLPEVYKEITEIIKPLEVPFEEGKLFQTDLVKKFDHAQIDQNLQNEITEALEILSILSKDSQSSSLKDFRQKFYERYESQEMPFLEVLDTETGIGYGSAGKSHNTPIADGLILPSGGGDSEHKISLSPVQLMLFEKWKKADKEGAYHVEITDEDLKTFQGIRQKLPPSFPLMFRYLSDEKYSIHLESIGGSSAANLLGRFAHADPAVNEVVADITRIEQEKNPDIVFAEIVHLPESRVGNILLHPVFRNYEIPYLAKSALPQDQQIRLQDLTVSVDMQAETITVKSKTLNKEVIPRLSSAHNYSYNSLPVYHFLCDLQTHKLTVGLSFSWNPIIPKAKFTPRLVYKKIILESAAWSLEKDDLLAVINANSESQLSELQKVRTQFQIPRYFVLADGDNELLVDAENSLSVSTWLDAIKNRPMIALKEFLFEKNSPIHDLSGQPYSNQFVAVMMRDDACYRANYDRRIIRDADAQRKFSLGSEWVYFKFYCGTKTADKILTEAIKPLTEELLAQNLIDKWFFIRYSDPDKHIRFRMHLSDLSALGEVLQKTNFYIQPFQDEGIIFKTLLDTYERELERYGSDGIELAETIFWKDSTAIVDMIDQTWGDERETIRWQWGLKAIDDYMEGFGFTTETKMALMENMKEGFALEFKMDKNLRVQMDTRFRDNRQRINKILDKSNDVNHEYSPLFDAIYTKKSQLEITASQIKAIRNNHELSTFLSDSIHMTVNRVISDNQRLHELMMYDFLFNYYRSKLAQERKGAKIKETSGTEISLSLQEG
jgi:lantibiotic biosynthesis protein